MTKKELTVIQNCIRNAKSSIEELACENYPFTEFCDRELGEMFYTLNDMGRTLSRKIEALEG